MVQYRRNRVVGGCCFFTVNLRDRKTDLLVRYVDYLRESFAQAKRKNNFVINAIVILPDHLHTVWTLPDGDDDFPGRWRDIKSHFTRCLEQHGHALQKSVGSGLAFREECRVRSSI